MEGGGATATPHQVIDLENDHQLFPRPISCRGTNNEDPISVELYTEQRDLHRAIRASLFIHQQPQTSVIDVDQLDEDVQIITPNPTSPFFKRRSFEKGSSSSSSPSSCPISNNAIAVFMCEICTEPKPQFESFNLKGCSHSYCSECMVRYVASKLQDNVTSIRCPESKCLGVLEPEFCQSILPRQVFDRWSQALCESLILGTQKFYCPYKECSALLVDDGGIVLKQCVCPHCNKMFCAQCKVPWHLGISCEEFQKLNKNEREREDIMLMQLAKKNKWQRCPKCMFYVERIEGCMYMKCRCKHAFCYHCAAPMQAGSHNCTQCRRQS